MLIYLSFLVLLTATTVRSIPLHDKERKINIKAKASADDPAQCGISGSSRQLTIVHGQNVSKNEFPWMGFVRNYYLLEYCSSTLINNQWMMMAAHCVHRTPPEKIKINLGGRNTTLLEVLEVVTHPKYNQFNHGYDIGLVKLSEPVTFNESINPICLPSGPPDKHGKNMTIVGYGKEHRGQATTLYLKQATVQTVGDAVCQARYAGMKPSTTLCAIGVSGNTCSGDSGGFLGPQFPDGHYEQYGITSMGTFLCAQPMSPAMFTDVWKMKQWILSETSSN